MELYELALSEALRAASPRQGFFDELLETLREMWEIPSITEASQPAGHSPWVVAGSVAAATAGAVGAGAAWYGLKRRHRKGGAA